MKSHSRIRLPMVAWFLSGSLLLIMTACSSSSPPNRPWVQADLRALSQKVTASPATDILAVYTRTTDLSVDIRVDLLDINPGDAYSLKIALWDDRNFSKTPLTINVSATGAVQTSGIQAGKPAIWPRVVQDYQLDTVTVSLNRAFIGDHYHLNVSSYTTTPLALADEIDNIRSDGPPPRQYVAFLMAFWNVFPATTPTQALRDWDGAHSGPLGSRHGLKYLLAAAGQFGYPMALVDLKNPASLAALDFMGNLPEIKDLQARGLLLLPDVAFGEPATVALGLSNRAAAGFGLTSSQFVYALSADPLASLKQAALDGYQAQFLPLADDTHLAKSEGRLLIPLPTANAMQATQDGPSLEVRRALISTALSADPADLVVLGGSLPQSTWGDPDMADPTLEWIAAHPWIQPLASPEMLAFPSQPLAAPVSAAPGGQPWLKALQSAPENAASLSAWQTYMTLTAYTPDPQLQALGRAYLGQVGELLAASDWARQPTARADCNVDLNGDRRDECILANRQYFAIIETDGARLTQFFYRDANGPHQLVGPSAQFAIGLSDPSEWHPENGEAADPNSIPGAFSDASDTWTDYTPTIQPDGISFTSPDGRLIKNYQLTTNGIEVQYQGSGPVSTQIPLAVDPQRYYSGLVNYRATLAPDAWTWNLTGGSRVEVSSDATLTAEAFTAAIPFLSSSEDPNLDYPKGDYLPFPLSLVMIQSSGNFRVEITVNE
ncbi:MAG: hypothetical protein ABSA01_13765 [Anaerolineales bacterium]